jgi:phosphate transport system substrate-binding protein
MNKKLDTPTDGITYIAVDETFAPIIKNEVEVFENIYKSTGIIDFVCPEIEAFNLMMKDSVRMIVATRLLTEKETGYFHSKKIFPKELKIAVDGIAFIVNHANPDTLITTNVIQRIMLGEITEWKQINPASKLGAVKMIFDNPKSSTAEYAVKTICENRQLSSNLSAMNSNPDVFDFVSKNQGAIGLIGSSWVSNRKDSLCTGFLKKIKVVALSKEEKATTKNSFKPYQAFLSSGQYPYTRTIFLILTEPRVSLNTGFASFIISERGQRIILKSGILPAIQPQRFLHVKEDF